jgi:hypothetical protein
VQVNHGRHHWSIRRNHDWQRRLLLCWQEIVAGALSLAINIHILDLIWDFLQITSFFDLGILP